MNRAQMDYDFRGNGKDQKVECSECGKALTVGSLAGHLANQHNVYQSSVLEEQRNDTSRRKGVTAAPCGAARKGVMAVVCGAPRTCGDNFPTATMAMTGEYYSKCRLC